MILSQVFDEFMYQKKLAGLTNKSLNSYHTHLQVFLAFTGADKKLYSMTQQDVFAYIEYQIERPISRATLSTYIRDLKIFVAWIERFYNMQLGAASIRVPKSPKTLPRIYSDGDVALMFRNVSAEKDWIRFRNCSMIALMYDSGLRQAEVCILQHSDFDLSRNILRVYGKGNKMRMVPIGKLTQDFMQRYLENCPYKSDYVFVGRRGVPVTENALKLLVSKLARKLPFELSCHKLRHNFATNYCIDQYEKYGHIDIYSLKALMGHENIETTERYLHLAMDIIASRNHISHLDKIKKELPEW